MDTFLLLNTEVSEEVALAEDSEQALAAASESQPTRSVNKVSRERKAVADPGVVSQSYKADKDESTLEVRALWEELRPYLNTEAEARSWAQPEVRPLGVVAHS